MKVHEPTKRPTLAEAQAMVGGYVQLLHISDDEQLLVNEEGRLLNQPVNAEASARWPFWGPLVGDVVHLTGDACWRDDNEEETS